MAKKIKLPDSFEAACKAQGLNPENVLSVVSNMPEKDQAAITAFAKMCVIQRSLNGNWVPDWKDYNQPKYYPWFDVEEKEGGASGFGLSFDDCGCGHAFTRLGVRLFYKDRETAQYAGKQFISLYEDMILVPR